MVLGVTDHEYRECIIELETPWLSRRLSVDFVVESSGCGVLGKVRFGHRQAEGYRLMKLGAGAEDQLSCHLTSTVVV